MNGRAEKALDLFERTSLQADETLYVIMFDVCGSLSNERAMRVGMQLFHQMPKKFFDQITVTNAAIFMLMKFGHLAQAERLYEQSKASTLTLHNTMIHGYTENHQPGKALQILENIKQQHLTLDEATTRSLLKACSQIGHISTCRRVFSQIPLHLRKAPHLVGSLIDMWVSCYRLNHLDA